MDVLVDGYCTRYGGWRGLNADSVCVVPSKFRKLSVFFCVVFGALLFYYVYVSGCLGCGFCLIVRAVLRTHVCLFVRLCFTICLLVLFFNDSIPINNPV